MEVVEDDQERTPVRRPPQEGGRRIEELKACFLRILRRIVGNARQTLEAAAVQLGKKLSDRARRRIPPLRDPLRIMFRQVGADDLHPRPIDGSVSTIPATTPQR